MKKILNLCQRLILENYKGEITASTLEALSIAVMALYLRNEKLTLERLPKLLQNITIYAENKSILDITRERFENFGTVESQKNIGACILRGFDKDIQTGEIFEDKFFLVSTSNISSNPVDVIAKMTHEFTHLLRDGKFIIDGKSLKIRNGISVVRIPNIDTGVKKTKHFYFEEGIVQRYTNQSLDMLASFLESQSLPDDSLLARFKQEYPSEVKSPYELQVSIVDTLCMDERFNELVDNSFYDEGTPSQIATYYNNKMNSSTAFSVLSRYTDTCFEELSYGNTSKTEDAYRCALTEVSNFLKCSKTKKY